MLVAVFRPFFQRAQHHFIETHVTAEACKPRKVLYEDPELGFCICGHVYEGPAAGSPHDHGPTWAIYGGLVTCVVLVASSPVVSGSETALFTGSDWSWFPLSNPGIISIPAGFLFGWLGTVTSKEPDAVAAYTELEVRSLTGAGAEAAVHH